MAPVVDPYPPILSPIPTIEVPKSMLDNSSVLIQLDMENTDQTGLSSCDEINHTKVMIQIC